MTLGTQTSFDDMGTPLHQVPFVILDLETTGGSANFEEITEIGAVKMLGGEVLGEFQTLVNPRRGIPPMITVLTGITQSMVIEAPPIEAVLPAFLEFCGDAIVVGHNVRFDLSFLNAACERLGYQRFSKQFLDTLSLSRRLIRSEVRNLKLSTLARYFSAPVQPTHRALDDAKATAHVFHKLLELVGTLGVTGLEDLFDLPRAKGSPNYGKIKLADELPRRPGVYLFKDRHNEVIYVGKATNLRSRVRSYFYGDNRRTITNMLNELVEIDHVPCLTELEASIIELRLIHAHIPRHNRKSKPSKTSQYLRLTAEAFPRLSVVRTLRDDGSSYLGPFRSRKAAEQVMHAIWDATMIRRCTGKPGSANTLCKYAQLGKSYCPCDGTLTEAEYALTVRQVRSAFDHSPEVLLQPLADHMRELSAAHRFEDAGRIKHRHDALRRALERRQEWAILQQAGQVIATSEAGDGVVIDGGYFYTSFKGSTTPLVPRQPTATPDAVPSSVAVAAEADLMWKFLNKPTTHIIDPGGLSPDSFTANTAIWHQAEQYLRAG